MIFRIFWRSAALSNLAKQRHTRIISVKFHQIWFRGLEDEVSRKTDGGCHTLDGGQ